MGSKAPAGDGGKIVLNVDARSPTSYDETQHAYDASQASADPDLVLAVVPEGRWGRSFVPVLLSRRLCQWSSMTTSVYGTKCHDPALAAHG